MFDSDEDGGFSLGENVVVCCVGAFKKTQYAVLGTQCSSAISIFYVILFGLRVVGTQFRVMCCK